MASRQKRAVFFEIEDWERGLLPQSIPGVDITLLEEPLHEGSLAAAEGAEIVSVFIRSRIGGDLLDRLPDLRLVATRSTGFDHVDLDACNDKGITVCNVPYYGENTVAEHTFALILALSRNVHKAYRRTVEHDFSLAGLQGFDLKGKTLGVVGAGHIGMHVIRIAKGFGMEVLAHDRWENSLIAEVLGFRYATLEELLASSDIVSLHSPLNAETSHLFNRENFSLMKRGALLINTARGGLVDTNALVWALDEGILGGAGLDVLEGEELIDEESQLLTSPEAADKMRLLLEHHILMRRPNVVITPHIAFFSGEALGRIADCTVANIAAWLEGQPQNVVNAPQRS